MKKKFKKIIFITALISSMSSLSAFAVPKNDTEKMEKISKNYEVTEDEEKKVKEFDDIIRNYKDGEKMEHLYHQNFNNYVYAKSEEERLETFEEFIGQQLLTSAKDNSISLYKLKMALINALNEKNEKKIQINLKEILRTILGIHFYNQYRNFEKQNDIKLENLNEQLESGEIGRFIELMVDKFEVEKELNSEGLRLSVKIDHFDEINKICAGETGSKERNIYNMYNLSIIYLYYAGEIISKYMNKK